MKYLKSGFFIITSSLLSISLVTALTTKSYKDIEVVKGNTYSISFDKDHNRLSNYTGSSYITGDAVCKTLSNNDVHIAYQNVKYSGDNWYSLPRNSEIYNASKISGISNISLITTSNSENLTLYYGFSARSDEYSLSLSLVAGETYSFDFNNISPNYFMISNDVSTEVTINMMEITFSCSDTYIPNYGETLSTNGSVATYGMYPYRKVISSYLYNEIKSKGISIGNGYYSYDNQYYYLDNTTYFTSRAINWEVISNNEGQYELLSQDVLDGHIFDTNTNIFADSELKTWLNSDFKDKAFMLNDSSLVDEIIILGKDDIPNKQSKKTEYSVYKGVYNPSNPCTRYWTSTTYNDTVCYVNYTGVVGHDKDLTATDVGVRPLIRVSSLK